MIFILVLMAEEKSLGKFFVYCGLILILFLVMIPVIFSFKGKLIRVEVLVLLFLMLLSLVGFAGYRKSWGEKALFFMFLTVLGNIVFVRYFTSKLFMLPLFLALVGFLMALPKREEKREFEEAEDKEERLEPYSEVFEEEKPAKVKTEFSPGKYVASKMGSVYHEPKCEWAKKIVEERRIWFKDKREAQRKKYKAHKCVE